MKWPLSSEKLERKWEENAFSISPSVHIHAIDVSFILGPSTQLMVLCCIPIFEFKLCSWIFLYIICLRVGIILSVFLLFSFLPHRHWPSSHLSCSLCTFRLMEYAAQNWCFCLTLSDVSWIQESFGQTTASALIISALLCVTCKLRNPTALAIPLVKSFWTKQWSSQMHCGLKHVHIGFNAQ